MPPAEMADAGAEASDVGQTRSDMGPGPSDIGQDVADATVAPLDAAQMPSKPANPGMANLSSRGCETSGDGPTTAALVWLLVAMCLVRRRIRAHRG